jgi:hypothetical protein
VYVTAVDSRPSWDSTGSRTTSVVARRSMRHGPRSQQSHAYGEAIDRRYDVASNRAQLPERNSLLSDNGALWRQGPCAKTVEGRESWSRHKPQTRGQFRRFRQQQASSTALAASSHGVLNQVARLPRDYRWRRALSQALAPLATVVPSWNWWQRDTSRGPGKCKGKWAWYDRVCVHSRRSEAFQGHVLSCPRSTAAQLLRRPLAYFPLPPNMSTPDLIVSESAARLPGSSANAKARTGRSAKVPLAPAASAPVSSGEAADPQRHFPAARDSRVKGPPGPTVPALSNSALTQAAQRLVRTERPPPALPVVPAAGSYFVATFFDSLLPYR